MRENRTYGSEGGESDSIGLPDPYRNGERHYVATVARRWAAVQNGRTTKRNPTLWRAWLRSLKKDVHQE